MAKKKQSIFSRVESKFVLSVGDEGIILTHVNGKEMLHRLFADSKDSLELNNYLKARPTVPVYVLADVVDQAYIQHSLPPVSALNIKKLVSRKLQRDFNPNDLKAAIPLGRSKTGRKEWNYLFVSVRNNPPLSDWIDFVSDLPNPFGGIYLLPVESMQLLKDLKKALNLSKDTKEWQILVSHNRVGGFRQVVYRQDQVVFTRIAQPVGHQTPDVTAGNIEQETLNTIEYIRRIGFEEKKGLNVIIVTSPDVRRTLEVNSLPTDSVHILTPKDAAELLDIPTSATSKDRFGDVVTAAHFASCKKHLLHLKSPKTILVESLQQSAIYIRLLAAGLICLMIALTGYYLYSSIDIRQQILLAEGAVQRDNTKLQSVQSMLSTFEEDPDKIKNTVKFYEYYNERGLDLLRPALLFSTIQGFDVNIESYIVDAIEAPNPKRVPRKMPVSIVAKFRLEYINSANLPPEEVLNDISLLVSDIEKKYAGWKVEFAGLPSSEDINIFATRNRNYAFQFEIQKEMEPFKLK